MLNKLLLYYLRRFPVDYGKNLVKDYVKLPSEKHNVEFKSPNGIMYYLDLTYHVMRCIYLMGIYERNTIRHLIKLINPGMTIVDVGANIGAYTLVLSKHLSGGQIYSFEPNPRTLKFLKKNIEINQVKNVNVIEFGLSDCEETAMLNTPSLSQASINKFKTSDQVEAIKLITLDKFCSENNINNIDILKIDIEGHEKKCLDGSAGIIDKSKNIIIIMEIDQNCYEAGYKKEFLFNYLINKGFTGFLPRGWPFKMKKITSFNENYQDNIIFIKKDRS